VTHTHIRGTHNYTDTVTVNKPQFREFRELNGYGWEYCITWVTFSSKFRINLQKAWT